MKMYQKNSSKEDVRTLLFQTGRQLLIEKGVAFLTARKLSEASGCSVGMIYNQFGNMDNFILEQNQQTIAEIGAVLQNVWQRDDFYQSMNRAVDVYMEWLINHQNLWLLLYEFHWRFDNRNLPCSYKKGILELFQVWEQDFDKTFAKLSKKERHISREVLCASLFTTSSFLLKQEGGKVHKKNICKLLANTFLAGLEVLKCVK